MLSSFLPITKFLLGVWLLIGLLGCEVGSPPKLQHSDGSKDYLGQKVVLSQQIPTIIPLSPALAEMCAEVLDDKIDRIVGVTRYTNYPPGLLGRPVVGTYVRFNLEAVVALKPGLVIATRDGNSADQISRLRDLGLKVVVIDTATIEDIRTSYRILGRALGLVESSNRVIARFDRGMNELAERAKGFDRPLTTMIQLERQPTIVVGGKGFLAEGLRKIGSISAFAEINHRYPKVSIEVVFAAKPDVILHLSLGPNGKKVTGWEGQKALKAVQNKRNWIVAMDGLVRPSLRFVEALGVVQRQLLVFAEAERKAQ